jgi:hypothetical protein
VKSPIQLTKRQLLAAAQKGQQDAQHDKKKGAGGARKAESMTQASIDRLKKLLGLP